MWGLLRVKTTASVYTPQLPPDIDRSLQMENVRLFILNSHTWCFGECLQNMVGI